MKLSKDFLTHNTGDDAVLVSTGKAEFSGVVRGNKTLGAILDILKADTTEDEIVRKMKERFDASEEIIRKDVNKVLTELRNIGALDE